MALSTMNRLLEMERRTALRARAVAPGSYEISELSRPCEGLSTWPLETSRGRSYRLSHIDGTLGPQLELSPNSQAFFHLTGPSVLPWSHSPQIRSSSLGYGGCTASFGGEIRGESMRLATDFLVSWPFPSIFWAKQPTFHTSGSKREATRYRFTCGRPLMQVQGTECASGLSTKRLLALASCRAGCFVGAKAADTQAQLRFCTKSFRSTSHFASRP